NAADLQEAETQPPRAVPAIYVLGEENGDSALGVTGLPIQNITTTVKLVLWVRNAGGAAAIVAAMSALEAEVRRVFFGWRPSPEFKPLTIRASGAEQAYGSHLIRQLLLTTSYRQTAEGTP
ncbi:MAG TPA: hypothetical protein VFN09_11445, partial [Rhodanobacteraceae bacterium]|nr:hypothetical protein [Rhodanobacteraceae bacterium]